jgi:hypothetical protein
MFDIKKSVFSRQLLTILNLPRRLAGIMWQVTYRYDGRTAFLLLNPVAVDLAEREIGETLSSDDIPERREVCHSFKNELGEGVLPEEEGSP